MQKRENRKRYIQKLIRLTPEEDRQIKTAMAQMGVPSFQYYAKNQLVQGLSLIHISEDKINYYKTNKVYKGMMPVVTKEIGKEKAR